MGGVSTGSMVKHLQQHDDAQNLKIAFISEQNKFIEPPTTSPSSMDIRTTRRLSPTPSRLSLTSGPSSRSATPSPASTLKATPSLSRMVRNSPTNL